MWAEVPLDLQRPDGLLTGPEVARSDGHGIVQAHDVAHPRHSSRLTVINVEQPPAIHRTGDTGGHQHAGDLQVDGKVRLAVDLRRRIQTLRGGAQQLELLGGFQRHCVGQWQRRSRLDQVAIGRLQAIGAKHLAVLRMAQARRDAPLQSSRLDQQDARRSARPTQRLPGNTSRSRTTGGLKLHQAVGIQRRVRWRFLDHHLIQGHFQLLGDHHGNTGLRTLAHFNFRRDHRDHAIGANADKGTVTLRGVITKPTCRSRLGGCAFGHQRR